MFPYDVDIKASVETLQNGGLILYPTDTVWGIGCDATNKKAISKIFALKKREDAKALIVLIASENAILNYVDDPAPTIFDYIKGVHKPTTIIYNKAKNLPANLLSAEGAVAIRICADPFCKNLIKLFGKPIVSTSANISGYPTPLIFRDISLDIIEGVDYVVQYRQDETELKQPSSIVRWDANGELIIIRP